MEPSNSIINLGDLSKPVNTLIEKISDAIGGIFKPHQIRRIAEAEAEADKIMAVSQIEITELQNRALQRFFFEEEAV
jgi:c-di-GMP-binding flagellar brake protein YcgR